MNDVRAPVGLRRRGLLTLGGAVGLAGCALLPSLGDAPLTLAPTVDLDRYFGRWYIIANIPYFAERGEVGSYVDYARRTDGQIADVYFGHDRSFSAPLTRTEGRDYVVPGTNNARWRATFFWPIYLTYPILYVSSDYSVALVGYPDRSLGWVFSRTPEMDETTYRALLARFAAEGYDTARFQRVPQNPAQIGEPGFQ